MRKSRSGVVDQMSWQTIKISNCQLAAPVGWLAGWPAGLTPAENSLAAVGQFKKSGQLYTIIIRVESTAETNHACYDYLRPHSFAVGNEEFKLCPGSHFGLF
jgi:hypothetical protein